MARRRRHFVERAVDAVTDFELSLERLEMNVARPVLDRLIQDQIDEANDRGGVRFGFDIRDRRFVAVECHQLAGFAELLEDLLHAGGVVAVMLFQAFLDLLAWARAPPGCRGPSAKRRSSIVWVSSGSISATRMVLSSAPIGKGAVQARQPCGNQHAEFAGVNSTGIEIDHFRPERVGDDLVELRFVDNPMIDHRLVDRFSILRRLEKNVVGLGAIHHALVDEKVGEAFVIHSLRILRPSRAQSVGRSGTVRSGRERKRGFAYRSGNPRLRFGITTSSSSIDVA